MMYRNQYSDKISSVELLKQMLQSIPEGDACLEWPRSRGKGRDNYGHLSIATQTLGKAHRLAFELTFGPIPDGIKVCHTCDNPPCFRPSHLFLGTDLDNMADKMRKGRAGTLKGSSHGEAKLTENQVLEIHRLYSLGWSKRRISGQFEVTPGTIAHVVKGRNWQHVVNPYANVTRPNRATKLTEDAVVEIHRLRSMGRTLRSIADVFHVTPCLIGFICRGVAWRHVPNPYASAILKLPAHEPAGEIN